MIRFWIIIVKSKSVKFDNRGTFGKLNDITFSKITICFIITKSWTPFIFMMVLQKMTLSCHLYLLKGKNCHLNSCPFPYSFVCRLSFVILRVLDDDVSQFHIIMKLMSKTYTHTNNYHVTCYLFMCLCFLLHSCLLWYSAWICNIMIIV